MKNQESSKFSVLVNYVQPEFEELKRRFPTHVDKRYRDNRFNPIERCKGVSKENREVTFEYVQMGRHSSIDEVLDEMDFYGLRPALYEELLSFAEKYPNKQRKHHIVALGSELCMRGYRYASFLSGAGSGRRYLDLHWLGDNWHVSYRFLSVCK